MVFLYFLRFRWCCDMWPNYCRLHVKKKKLPLFLNLEKQMQKRQRSSSAWVVQLFCGDWDIPVAAQVSEGSGLAAHPSAFPMVPLPPAWTGMHLTWVGNKSGALEPALLHHCALLPQLISTGEFNRQAFRAFLLHFVLWQLQSKQTTFASR